MNQHTFSRAVASLLALAACAEMANAAESSRPNILLILTDDQGYGDLSCHGNPYLRTPNIDRLGAQGVQFERFYVNTFCSPTRAALLTGRYPLRCGVWGVTHSKETMRAEEVTLAEALRGAGYRTACIGKWHNGEQYPYTPPGQGFDESFGFHNGHWNNYFDAELLRGATFEKTRGYITDVLTDEAVRFVRDNRARPFFCYLACNAPHSPYQVPDRYFDRFKAKGLDDAVAAFYGMCENIDDNVGRLLALLDELRLTENTIVLFLTDNGGTAGVKLYNAGMRGGKTSVHEGGSRVPLFVRWPARFKQPRVVKELAAHIDIYPTLLDLCGIRPPPGPPLDGRSLVPLLDAPRSTLDAPRSAWPKRVLFLHNPISETNQYPGAVRTSRWRLVREIKGPGGGSRAKANDASAAAWQLYDMEADPGEKNDLAATKPEVVEQLSKLYDDWYRDISSSGLRRLPIQVGHAEENPVTLHAPQAYFEGGLRFFAGPGFAHDWLTGWTSTEGKVWWDVDVVRAGRYELTLGYLCPQADAGARIRVTVGNQSFEATVAGTPIKEILLPHRTKERANVYKNMEWATLKLGRAHLNQGPAQLTVRVLSKPGSQVMDLKHAVFKRVE